MNANGVREGEGAHREGYQMHRGWLSRKHYWLYAVVASLTMLLVVACGSRPRVAYAPAQTSATGQSTAMMSVLKYTTGVPSLVMVHHTLSVLTINVSHNQLVLYRRVRSRWHAQMLMTASLSRRLAADTLTCTSSACLAAGALVGSGSQAEIVVFRQQHGSATWKPMWKTMVPTLAAGQTLQLVAQGSTAWLMSAGSPGAGTMAKLLWESPNEGKTWHLIASGDMPGTKAPFTMPTGYPTGIVITSPGTLLVSMSPRGNSAVVAMAYTLKPFAQHLLTFRVPAAFRPVQEALPALVNPGSLAVPLIESSSNANGFVALALFGVHTKSWSIRQIEPVENNTPIVLSGSDTAVLMNMHTLQVISPGRPVVTLPIRRRFTSPLVASVIGRGRVLVLGTNGTLWVNSISGAWRIFNP